MSSLLAARSMSTLIWDCWRNIAITLTIVPQRPFHPLDRCTLLRVVSARGSGNPVADTRSPEKTPHEAEADWWATDIACLDLS